MFCVLLKDFSRYWLFLCFPQYLEPLEFSDKRSKRIFYLVIFIIIKIRPHGSPGSPSPKYCWSLEAEAPTKAQEGSHHLHPSWRSVKTLWKNGFVIGFFGFFRTRWNVSRTLSNLKDWWSSLLLVANIWFLQSLTVSRKSWKINWGGSLRFCTFTFSILGRISYKVGDQLRRTCEIITCHSNCVTSVPSVCKLCVEVALEKFDFLTWTSLLPHVRMGCGNCFYLELSQSSSFTFSVPMTDNLMSKRWSKPFFAHPPTHPHHPRNVKCKAHYHHQHNMGTIVMVWSKNMLTSLVATLARSFDPIEQKSITYLSSTQ